jgi:hypothetical protein
MHLIVRSPVQNVDRDELVSVEFVYVEQAGRARTWYLVVIGAAPRLP